MEVAPDISEDESALQEARLAEEIQRLDEMAAKDPVGYRRRVAALAVLGNLYIAGVSVGLVLLSLLFLWFMQKFHAWVLIKFAWIFLAAVFLILKSLWVKVQPPEGLEIRREQAPELFALIDRIQEASGVKHLHKVLILDEFNCAVVQMPRFGSFGMRENYLLLGLPLMDALPVEEFTAVLAHEFGHISSMHGRFGSWVHKVMMSWIQIYVALETQSVGAWPIRRFANWFIPMFEKQTLALRRAHEFAADKLAAELVGPEATAAALVRTNVCAEHLSSDFWTNIGKQQKSVPEPPKNVYQLLGESVRQDLPKDKVLKYLKADWKKHDGFDSHPALYERVTALLPDRDWSTVDNALAFSESRGVTAVSASKALLGASYSEFCEQLNQKWWHAAEAMWRKKYEENQDDREKYETLNSLFEADEINDKQAGELSIVANAVLDDAEAVGYQHRILERFPKTAAAHFALALHKMEEDSDDCIELFQKSAELSSEYGLVANMLIANHLRKQNRSAEARVYEKQAQDIEALMKAASESTARLTAADVFLPNEIAPKRLQRIIDVLHSDERIEKAYLMQRKLPELLGGNENVLILRLKKVRWVVDQDETFNALYGVISNPELSGFTVAFWGSLPKPVADACEGIPNALVYDRTNAITLSSVTDEERKSAVSRSQMSFFAANKRTLIGFAVLFGFIYMGLHIPKARQPAQDPTNEYVRRLQAAIRAKWHPPTRSYSLHTKLAFVILKNGTVSDVHVAKSSGDTLMDLAGVQAVRDAAPFEPIPDSFHEPKADVEFTLDYNVNDNSK